MDTILTLEEVAKYLRVSERTVKEWANSGELPGGKLGGSWRFRREEIEGWLDRQLTPHKHSKALNIEYSTKSLINPSNISLTNYELKSEFLNFFIDKGAGVQGVSSREEVADAVFKREKLMSTGIGQNTAVPHVRLNNVKSLNIFIAVNNKPIEDYESIDNKPIQIGVFFVVGRNQHSEYIKALSIIMERIKKPLIHQQILDSADEKEIYNSLTQER